jgi:sorbose reductase
MTSSLHDGDLKTIRNAFSLQGGNYIVTGGGRGIGYAITRAIAEMGGNVVVLDILSSPVDDFATLSELGVKTKYVRTDVTDEDSLKRGFEEAMGLLGSLDGCVTAAGIAYDTPFLEQDWKQVRRVMDINVFSSRLFSLA